MFVQREEQGLPSLDTVPPFWSQHLQSPSGIVCRQAQALTFVCLDGLHRKLDDAYVLAHLLDCTGRQAQGDWQLTSHKLLQVVDTVESRGPLQALYLGGRGCMHGLHTIHVISAHS